MSQANETKLPDGLDDGLYSQYDRIAFRLLREKLGEREGAELFFELHEEGVDFKIDENKRAICERYECDKWATKRTSDRVVTYHGKEKQIGAYFHYYCDEDAPPNAKRYRG